MGFRPGRPYPRVIQGSGRPSRQVIQFTPGLQLTLIFRTNDLADRQKEIHEAQYANALRVMLAHFWNDGEQSTYSHRVPYASDRIQEFLQIEKITAVRERGCKSSISYLQPAYYVDALPWHSFAWPFALIHERTQ